ncbi:unnamed protein product [Linum trigynum]|uniref:Reverse transcriptase n=1 Tax=Linum trigynum TaxID=586398 RepID=A0AAV2DAY4_9ROSI
MKKCCNIKKGFFDAKLDMAKSYDKVDWDFLEKAMRKMCFKERWIDLMKMYYMAISYSTLVNRQRSIDFNPSRGLRQGPSIHLPIPHKCLRFSALLK